MQKIKRCINCGRFLGEKSFSWHNKAKGYRHSQCKKCHKVIAYLWRQKHRKTRGKSKRELKKFDAAYYRAWYQENKERVNKQRREGATDEQRERHREYNRERYRKNLNNSRTKALDRYEKNKDEIGKKSREYQRNNPDKRNAIRARRKSRKLKLTVSLTKQEQEDIKILYKWAQILPGSWNVDHIMPLKLGGLHHPDNLQLIPFKQNMQKGFKDPKEFYGRFYTFLCRN